VTCPRLAALLVLASLGCSESIPASSTRPRSAGALDASSPGDASAANADGPVGCGAATLVEPSEYRALTEPLDGTVVFAADIDGDGHEDLVVSGSGTSLLRADGRGGYQTEPVSRSPLFSRGPVDLDGDGRPDLVVTERAASGDDYQISLLLNDGKGHFHRSFPVVTSAEPLAVVAADIDGDGRQDLVVSEWDSGAGSGQGAVWAHVLRQDQGFLFRDTAMVSVASRFYFSSALGAGDLDSDGDVDLVIGFDNSALDTGLTVAWNDHGAFTLDPSPLVSTGWPILVVDLDRDGHQDIVDSRRVYRGLGDHRFEKHVVSTSSGPVTAADLDGDGALDLVVRASTELMVHRQLANLTWKTTSWPAPGTPTFFSSGPIAAAVTDVTGDGKKDVVFSDTGGRLQELEGPAFRGPSTRRQPLVADGQPFTVGMAGADFDRDGQTDVVQFNYSELVVLANRRGTLVESVVLETRDPAGSQVASGDVVSAGVVADLDGDGRSDLAAVTKGGWIVTFLNRARDVWERGPELAVSPSTSASLLEAEALAAGDLDADGDVDLVVSQHDRDNPTTDAVSFFWNDGHGQFAAPQRLPFPDEKPHALAVADLDGDGRPELLVGSDRSPLTPRVHVYQARPGSIERRSSIDVDNMSMIQKVFPADLDGDGAIDLLVSLWWRGQRVLWNDGHGGFGPPTALDACPSSLVPAMVVADVDNDGDRDLVMACNLDSEVGLVLSDGKRGFTVAPPLYSDDDPSGLVAADLDGRCGTDLVVANGSLSGELWVFLNGPVRKP
jgi:hypothetical protein